MEDFEKIKANPNFSIIGHKESESAFSYQNSKARG
jgi:hypothetical protein